MPFEMRYAAALLAMALLTVPGCERPSIDSGPNPAFDELYVPVDSPPDPELATDPVVAASKSSVVKMLGYPPGGAFMATPARVRDITELSSTDIYGTVPVTRQVYTVRGTVKQISGAPLVDVHAHVLGVVFGAAVNDPETGFVLTSDQIVPQLAKLGNTAPVATGPWGDGLRDLCESCRWA